MSDLPDPAFHDADCDGIDGQINAARFVSPAGNDANQCSRLRPCRTVRRAISRAAALGKRDVYVAGGSYRGFRVASGVNVFGGFGRNFQRAPNRATGSRTVTVAGALALGDGPKVTVLADQVTRQATLADLTVKGADAVVPGGSSYVIAGHGSTLRLTRLHLIAGDGASGADGSDGADATSLLAPPPAITGGPSVQSNDCDGSTHGAGGSGAINALVSSGRDTTGGAGGAGGEMDTDCPFDLDATAGDAGSPAVFDPAGLPGDGGGGGVGGDDCDPGITGQPGAVANGPAGQAARIGPRPGDRRLLGTAARDFRHCGRERWWWWRWGRQRRL